MNSIAILVNGQWQNQSGTLPVQDIISNTSDLLGNDSLWENMEKEQRLLSASILLQSMKDLVIATGLNLPDQGKKNSTSKNIGGVWDYCRISALLFPGSIFLDVSGGSTALQHDQKHQEFEMYPDGYGSHTNCWLDAKTGLVWSFLGPVYLIIAVNTVLFFTFLWILKREVAKRDTQVSKLNDTR
ncbi:hypothetical protein scyTo_0020210, partial [Scyliorhinus torazame]|nr:hypothetical protein [Scyliorhinus torazame]